MLGITNLHNDMILSNLVPHILKWNDSFSLLKRGFEPPNLWLTVTRSNQLNYSNKLFVLAQILLTFPHPYKKCFIPTPPQPVWDLTMHPIVCPAILLAHLSMTGSNTICNKPSPPLSDIVYLG